MTKVYYAVLFERTLLGDAVDALLNVAAVAGVEGHVRITIPYTRTDTARNRLVSAFMQASESPHDTLVMLDADHVHPPDIVKRLARYPQGVVGALAFRRSAPHDPCWFVRAPDGRLRQPAEFEVGSLYECDAVGTGAIAIKRWVFERLAAEHGPAFFKYEYLDGGFSPSEDIYFARICEEAGIRHHVDTGLETPHIVNHAIALADWQAQMVNKPELVTEE